MGSSDYLILPKKQKNIDKLQASLIKKVLDMGGNTPSGEVVCLTIAKQNISIEGAVAVKEGDKLVCFCSDRGYINANLQANKKLIAGAFDSNDAMQKYHCGYRELFDDIDYKGTYVEDNPPKIYNVEPEAKDTAALAQAEKLKARLIVSEGFSKVLRNDMDYFDAKFTDTLIDTLGEEAIEIKSQLKNTGLNIENVHPDFDELLDYTNSCTSRAGRIPLEAYGWDEQDVKIAINNKVQEEHPELRCACLFSKAFLNQADGVLSNQARNENVASSDASQKITDNNNGNIAE